MGRQFRAPRAGGSGTPGSYIEETLAYPTPASSVGRVQIPNYGFTNLSTFAAGEYVLDAPVPGVYKTFVWASSSSTAVVVRLSTGTSVKAGHTGATQLTFGLTTTDGWAQLLGINSTRWAVTNITIPSTLASVFGSTVASVTLASS